MRCKCIVHNWAYSILCDMCPHSSHASNMIQIPAHHFCVKKTSSSSPFSNAELYVLQLATSSTVSIHKALSHSLISIQPHDSLQSSINIHCTICIDHFSVCNTDHSVSASIICERVCSCLFLSTVKKGIPFK